MSLVFVLTQSTYLHGIWYAWSPKFVDFLCNTQWGKKCRHDLKTLCMIGKVCKYEAPSPSTDGTILYWVTNQDGPTQDPSPCIFNSCKRLNIWPTVMSWQCRGFFGGLCFKPLSATPSHNTFQKSHDELRHSQHQEPRPLSSGQLGGSLGQGNPQGPCCAGTTSEVLGDPFSRCSLMPRRSETTKGDGRCWESLLQINNYQQRIIPYMCRCKQELLAQTIVICFLPTIYDLEDVGRQADDLESGSGTASHGHIIKTYWTYTSQRDPKRCTIIPIAKVHP